ncbi:MAG: pseudouridine synthase [Patescibacteria group bacterium]|nr:pseudouridine synthase [Patescibacteria group bacterium]
MRRALNVAEGAATERLDIFLAGQLGVTRSRAQTMLRAGHVRVNGRAGRPSYLVRPGDALTVDEPEVVTADVAAPDLPIIYQDADLLVIDKPAGLVVHGGSGTAGQATVADFARAHTADPDPERPGIVHRLDQDTSGLMILAKTLAAKAALQELFREHGVHKTYSALVVGRLDRSEATIRLPIARDPAHPLRRAVVSGGRDSTTHYRILAAYPGYTLVEARPQTGRTHQLRVHFAALGHPIAGDTTYGAPRRPLGLKRQFLHATALSLVGPSGQRIELTSPLPADLRQAVTRLEKTI